MSGCHTAAELSSGRHLPALCRSGAPGRCGGAANLPYAIPNLHVDRVWKETGVPISPWCSVGSSQNALITESFLGEIAAAVPWIVVCW